MLVDVKRDKVLHCIPGCEEEFKKDLKLMGEWKLQKIKTGFFHAGLNPHIILKDSIKDEWPVFGNYPNGEALTIQTEVDTWFNCYGVCDSPEQFIGRFEEKLQNDPRKLFVTFFKIEKKKQPKQDGWRWHKWGPYIGDKNPQHEHIFDEDESILEVHCYHVREAK